MCSRCGKFYIRCSWRETGVSYKKQPSLLKQELEHDETYEDNWHNKEDEWLPDVKNDLSSIAFCYARYTMGMEEITNFGIEKQFNITCFSK